MINIFKMEKYILSINENERAIMEIALVEFIDRIKAETKRFRKRAQYKSIESNRRLKKNADKAWKKLHSCQGNQIVAETADDEPIFILRGSDPVASFLVGAWRMLHANDRDNALRFIENARIVTPELAKSHEDSKAAYNVSVELENFYQIESDGLD